jgi:hypothetical protein
MPTSDGSLRDVEDRVLKRPCMHYLPLSFASSDICICPAEYDESLAYGKHNGKGNNCIYKR